MDKKMLLKLWNLHGTLVEILQEAPDYDTQTDEEEELFAEVKNLEEAIWPYWMRVEGWCEQEGKNE